MLFHFFPNVYLMSSRSIEIRVIFVLLFLHLWCVKCWIQQKMWPHSWLIDRKKMTTKTINNLIILVQKTRNKKLNFCNCNKCENKIQWKILHMQKDERKKSNVKWLTKTFCCSQFGVWVLLFHIFVYYRAVRFERVFVFCSLVAHRKPHEHSQHTTHLTATKWYNSQHRAFISWFLKFISNQTSIFFHRRVFSFQSAL